MILKFYCDNQGKFIFISILLACIFGMLASPIFIHLTVITDIFVNLMKSFSLPILISSLILTIANFSEFNKLKKISLNMAIYIIISNVIAIFIGVSLFNFFNIHFHPIHHILLNHNNVSQSTSSVSFEHILYLIFPRNIWESILNFDILPTIIFSIMLGMSCLFSKEKSRPFLEVVTSIRAIFLNLLNAVFYLSPLILFILVGSLVAKNYLSGQLASNMTEILKFILLFVVAGSCHLLWQFIFIVILYRNIPLTMIFKKLFPIFSTAFISSSSLATLPIALEKASELGGHQKVVNFMLPICATISFSAGVMYIMIAVLFFMKILGIEISFNQELLLAFICITSSLMYGGLPETSMMSFVAVFTMAHVPLNAINILLPFDKIMDRFRTAINILGNTCGTLIISKIHLGDKK